MEGKSKDTVVMFVDDDNVFVDIVCHRMNRDGLTCTYASNGETALKMLEVGPAPHLIILDIMMPGIDGFEVLKKLKANPKTKNIPVVMFSNDKTPENVKKAKDLGADRLVEKVQTDSSEFTSILEEIIRNHAVAA